VLDVIHCLFVRLQHVLTTEEMRPYVDRVLLHPTNWMVHSMSLLFRCRLEYGNYLTQHRATFQLQALVDQQTNQLSITQFTRDIVENSAPVQVRCFMPMPSPCTDAQVRRRVSLKLEMWLL